RPQVGDAVLGEEGRREPLLHVGDHGLQRLLAHLGPVAGLVPHAALLAAHAEGARLAGVLAAHGGPEAAPADAAGHAEGVEDGGETAAGAEGFHGRLRASDSCSCYRLARERSFAPPAGPGMLYRTSGSRS